MTSKTSGNRMLKKWDSEPKEFSIGEAAVVDDSFRCVATQSAVSAPDNSNTELTGQPTLSYVQDSSLHYRGHFTLNSKLPDLASQAYTYVKSSYPQYAGNLEANCEVTKAYKYSSFCTLTGSHWLPLEELCSINRLVSELMSQN